MYFARNAVDIDVNNGKHKMPSSKTVFTEIQLKFTQNSTLK